jgi:hypothetical protein
MVSKCVAVLVVLFAGLSCNPTFNDVRMCSDPLSDPKTCQGPAPVRTDGGGSSGDRRDAPAPFGEPSSGEARDAGPGGGAPIQGPTGPVATDPGCQTGFHRCNGVCRDSKDPATCGIACSPCPSPTGGEATCDGTKCGVQCPQGHKPCDNKCVAVDATCQGCPPGTNFCNGLCVPPTEKTACGPSCIVCPTSANGTATCDGECRLNCNAGYHLCGSQCVPNDSSFSCGSACSPCPTAVGGGAECVNGTCRKTCPPGRALCERTNECLESNRPCGNECPPGQHSCNGICVANSDINNCGESCSPCVAPANADALCFEGKACSFQCRSGYRQCDGECFPKTDPMHCGPECKRCSSEGGVPSCDGNGCDITCGPGYFTCFPNDKSRKRCTAAFRGFESGTNEGFHLFDATKGVVIEGFMPSQTKAHSGRWSVAVRLDKFPKFQWGQDLCIERVTDALELGGKTLTFWYYVDQPVSDVLMFVSAGTTSDYYVPPIVVGQWTQVRVKFDVNQDNKYNHIYVTFETNRPPNVASTIFLDDFEILQ